MKILQNLLLLILLGWIVAGCSEEDRSYLTRIDIQKLNEEELYENEAIVVDLITLDSLKSLFDVVEWKPNSLKEMETKEDLELTLFFTYDKNMPEKLNLYRVWFKDDDEVIIISNNEEQGFGTLKDENAEKLRDLLLSQFVEKERGWFNY